MARKRAGARNRRGLYVGVRNEPQHPTFETPMSGLLYHLNRPSLTTIDSHRSGDGGCAALIHPTAVGDGLTIFGHRRITRRWAGGVALAATLVPMIANPALAAGCGTPLALNTGCAERINTVRVGGDGGVTPSLSRGVLPRCGPGALRLAGRPGDLHLCPRRLHGLSATSPSPVYRHRIGNLRGRCADAEIAGPHSGPYGRRGRRGPLCGPPTLQLTDWPG